MFHTSRHHQVLDEIAETTERCRETLNRLVAKHSRLVGERFTDVDKVIGARYELAKSTNISNHVWHIYSDFFQSLSENDDAVPGFDVKIIQAARSLEGKTYLFSLAGNRYRLSASNRIRSHQPNDYSDYYKLELKDASGRCILAFRVYGERYEKVTIFRPASLVEAFIPGDWVADFVAVSTFYKAWKETRITESLHTPERVKARKLKFGVGG